MSSSIAIKQGEGKWIRFNVTLDGVAVNLSAATLRFVLKSKYSDTTYLIEKEDADFDKASAASGIVRINLTATETAALAARNYLGELEAVFVAESDLDKSATITVTIQPAVTHD